MATSRAKKKKKYGSSWTICISLGGKCSSRMGSLCGLDPALRAMLGKCTARKHNSLCPSFNHTTTAIVLPVRTLSELMRLQEDPSVWAMISQPLCPLLVWTEAKRKTIPGRFLKVLASYFGNEDNCSRRTGRCGFLPYPLLRDAFASA